MVTEEKKAAKAQISSVFLEKKKMEIQLTFNIYRAPARCQALSQVLGIRR